jgi:hypothetical protein
MKKLAVFVEGNTELIFVEQLLLQIAGYQDITIDRQVMHGGRLKTLYGSGSKRGSERFHALLVNCESDGKVKPAILERKDTLKAQGYDPIIGLRDLYPDFKREQLHGILPALQVGLDDADALIAIVVAVMEIETWFLKEWTHLERISPKLTLATIQEATGIDLHSQVGEAIAHPADLLDTIYKIAGKRYKKKSADAHRTVHHLDFARLYFEIRNELGALNELMSYIDAFLSP